MNLPLYQVDAFTDKLFAGNPAAVCPLTDWLPDKLMQNIAMENNLAETAFTVPSGQDFHIRWFTPVAEVDLCGHATLATAHIFFNHLKHPGNEIRFHSRSGVLPVRKNADVLTLDFPADEIEPCEILPIFTNGLNLKPMKAFKGRLDYMLVFENESQVRSLNPDFRILSGLESRGVIVTATGTDADFISRYFAPQFGIDEDPATGSAHTTLTPYWANILGKNELTAIQISPRKGYLQCKHLGKRVEISGKAKTYLVGEIRVE